MKEIKIKNNVMKITTLEITCVALFSVTISICSWIIIPFGPVPFTMQTFALFLTIFTIGPKLSAYTFIVYLLLGIVGVPVFAGFGSGIGTVFGITGGYLIGFIFPILCNMISTKIFGSKAIVIIISAFVGLLLCYALGTIWFINVYTSSGDAIGIISVLGMTVFPFVIPDVLKLLLAYTISSTLRKNIKR